MLGVAQDILEQALVMQLAAISNLVPPFRPHRWARSLTVCSLLRSSFVSKLLICAYFHTWPAPDQQGSSNAPF